ncbi:hypothetical protein E2C01_069084 [Portunus trituberculatus]|uniref:Uncharacterized protein n=1 Tax=Portunus trituberculatus TaxID=210409 RepID=A0A5B7HQI5_PORTR|nr:hypothetical protein [Portunus trituberculatus]
MGEEGEERRQRPQQEVGPEGDTAATLFKCRDTSTGLEYSCEERPRPSVVTPPGLAPRAHTSPLRRLLRYIVSVKLPKAAQGKATCVCV